MIPSSKPEGISDIEWVALHSEFDFPEVTEPAFLAAFKRLMVEVVGERLYDYRAAEQIEKLLVADNLSVPGMEAAASAEGVTRYSKIMDLMDSKIQYRQGAAKKWKGHDPEQMDIYPAWELVLVGEENESEWRQRWLDAGGAILAPLYEGRPSRLSWRGMIAMKTDLIWQRLGEFDHPPFRQGSNVSWSTVSKIEAIAYGLMASPWSLEVTMQLIDKHIAREKKRDERTSQAIIEREKEYELRGK